MKAGLVLVAGVLALSGSPRAVAIDPEPEDCVWSEDASHSEFRACLEKKAAVSESRLAAQENEVRARIQRWNVDERSRERSAAAFESSVEGFQSYREKRCEFLASLAAGVNGAGDTRLQCMDELNAARIGELELTFEVLH
jgi:hypothetical protein